jgi:hypothetical protein
MAAAALCGTRGRLQKRSSTRHKFPLYPLFIFCLLLGHMEKAKGKRRALQTCSRYVQKSAFALSLACQKEPAPLLF